MNRRVLIPALLLVLALAACSPGAAPNSPVASNATHNLSGTLTVPAGEHGDTNSEDHLTTCTLPAGYSDLSSLGLTMKDADGKIIGTGTALTWDVQQPASVDGCRFTFTVPNLPDSTFYQLDMGRRGRLTWPRADLVKMGWKVEATLGE